MISEKQLHEALRRVYETDDLLAVEPYHRRVMYYLDEAVGQNIISALQAARHKEQINKHVQTLWAQKHEAIFAEREDPAR